MKAQLFTALFAASFAFAPPALSQQAPQQPNRFLAAQPAAAERFEIKGMLVERHGSGARALILVPGLSSGGWVWSQVARDFAPTHSVYVVTLPGFDGRPAVAGDPFDASRDALAELIISRKLVKPVLIGHSIGATLALALAQASPQQIGGVVAIDGLPVFPRTEDMPPEQRAVMADKTRQQMAALTGPAFAAQQLAYMRSIGLVDMGKADDAARLSSRSDPQAVAAYMGAALARDLRPGLARIETPVLVLAPYFAPDAPLLNNMTAADKVAYYRELMAGTPKLEVETIDKARHFAMIDQPEAVSAAIRRFLDRK
ncbi:alpha/beta fold hydrolase [Massilia sp. IC2-476]|uniref:alpha/beta fold hydrolase n=1 Tax=Massilia sp. IC2-476 TaxID=2887199 RepID=UPI001D118CAC|nr:alpha/beta hydrolase [Massilia sp. IC2-476]MCC2974451.1 alpha/beta hydrolase [Massilia sp. IC2-476]